MHQHTSIATICYTFGSVGVGLAVLGWLARHYAAKRRFLRTNRAGVEEFASYEQMVGFQFLEGLVGVIGTVLLVLGGVLVIMALALFPHPKP